MKLTLSANKTICRAGELSIKVQNWVKNVASSWPLLEKDAFNIVA
jgi:hypothetical protein